MESAHERKAGGLYSSHVRPSVVPAGHIHRAISTSEGRATPLSPRQVPCRGWPTARAVLRAWRDGRRPKTTTPPTSARRDPCSCPGGGGDLLGSAGVQVGAVRGPGPASTAALRRRRPVPTCMSSRPCERGTPAEHVSDAALLERRDGHGRHQHRPDQTANEGLPPPGGAPTRTGASSARRGSPSNRQHSAPAGELLQAEQGGIHQGGERDRRVRRHEHNVQPLPKAARLAARLAHPPPPAAPGNVSRRAVRRGGRRHPGGRAHEHPHRRCCARRHLGREQDEAVLGRHCGRGVVAAEQAEKGCGALPVRGRRTRPCVNEDAEEPHANGAWGQRGAGHA